MQIDELGSDFGALVRKAREARQWTQADLAAKLSALLGREVPTLAITRTESAKRPVPLAEVAGLAQLLNLEIDPLLNPAPVRGSRDELAQRADEVREQINQLHSEEVQLMAAHASTNQQLRMARTRKDDLERELQALERASRKDADGKQEHSEAPER
ncbi:multiprotein-bridging factor 1 family protein [Streptomyces sp. NBC_00989]|uniref:helix-turn-helix domain-containing protein n=1 Tax=Streptomyces sp. NBC_00989 TaxID=2903705 RepID=UPI00386B90DE|nr:helix-turn-helix domain-containing protein [Streptomyces sp. NBC_00989]